ncbi:hypothetical protein DM860_000103 [Cuscuta australis]|uniref:Uncharacterized protein n=1 Tax=Cuscuta australis TaxID=267555 RepID=A0A328CZB2_9ASTE|nr:hypothetical protein DM860_000103 [Cuscuta australis]
MDKRRSQNTNNNAREIRMEESSVADAAATSLQKKAPVAADDDRASAGTGRMPYNPFISLEDGSPCNDHQAVAAAPLLSPAVVAEDGTTRQRDRQAAAQNNGQCWCHPALEPFVHPASVLAGFESKCSLENNVAPALTTTGTSN